MDSDISTTDGLETRTTSHKQDKEFGLSYKIFQFNKEETRKVSFYTRNVYSGREKVPKITTTYFGK